MFTGILSGGRASAKDSVSYQALPDGRASETLDIT